MDECQRVVGAIE